MRAPDSTDELWGDKPEQEDEGPPSWARRLANAGVILAGSALIAAPVSFGLVYFDIQPYGNVLIVFALLGGLIGMLLGVPEQIASGSNLGGS